MSAADPTDPVRVDAEAMAEHPSMESEPGYNRWTCTGCGMLLAEGRASRAREAFGLHLASVAVAVATARPAIEREAKVAALREAADWIEAHPEDLDCEAGASVIAADRLRDRAGRIEREGQS